MHAPVASFFHQFYALPRKKSLYTRPETKEELKHRQEEEEAKREQEIAAQRKEEEYMVMVSDTTQQLQLALSSVSIPSIVAACVAVDDATALHPLLPVDDPQVLTLRTEANARAARLAEEAINSALEFRNGLHGISTASVEALKAAVSAGESVPFASTFESLQQASGMARRVAAYWTLRLQKPEHTAWTCDEVVAAFLLVAHAAKLPVDSTDAVIAYFASESVDGSILKAVIGDIMSVVQLVARRERLKNIVAVLCAPASAFTGASACLAYDELLPVCILRLLSTIKLLGWLTCV